MLHITFVIMMNVVIFLFFLNFQKVLTITCACKGYSECMQTPKSSDEEVCNGNYCFLYRDSEYSINYRAGCLSTAEDLSNFGCERNRKGGITCICSSSHCNTNSYKINKDDIHNATELTCNLASTSVPRELGRTCQGHVCSTNFFLRVNKYDDLFTEGMTASCDGEYSEFQTSLRVRNGPLEVADEYCYFIQKNGDFALAGCVCLKNKCNTQTVNPIKMGNILCYSHDGSRSVTYCQGQLCFATNYPNDDYTSRGCISSDQDKALFLRVNGKTNTEYCDYDLCNGIHFENETTLCRTPLFIISILVFSQYLSNRIS